VLTHDLLVTVQLAEDAYWRFEAMGDGAVRVFFTQKLGKPWIEKARFNQYFGNVEEVTTNVGNGESKSQWSEPRTEK
jgi:hypothetical protein